MDEDLSKNQKSGVRVLTPDEEEARAVARAMSSSTAGGILRSFQGKEMTASDIAAILDLPIPTILYHLDSLVDAGLIEISRIKYSVKGREIRVYRQSEQVFIVAPPHADLRTALLKYASLFGMTVFAAGLMTILTQSSPVFSNNSLALGGNLELDVAEKSVSAAPVVARSSDSIIETFTSGKEYLLPVSPPELLPLPFDTVSGIPSISMGILIGGCLVIIFLILTDFWSRRRAGKKRIY